MPRKKTYKRKKIPLKIKARKRLLSWPLWLVVIGLTIAGIIVTNRLLAAPTPLGPYCNAAQGKTVTTATNGDANYTQGQLSNLVDGNFSSIWYPGNYTIDSRVNLNGVYNLDTITVFWGFYGHAHGSNTYITNYNIQISTDGTIYNSVMHGATNTPPSSDYVTVTGAWNGVRYIRVVVSSGSNWIGMHEIEARQAGVSCSPPPAPLPAPKPSSPPAPPRAKTVPAPPPQPVSTGDKEAPGQPGNFQATALEGSPLVQLAWDKASDNVGVTGYILERSTDETSWQILNDKITDTTYTDETSLFNTTYTYRVVAFDAAGNKSAPSETKATTSIFLVNAGSDRETTIVSADDIAGITIPIGALTEEAVCSVEADRFNLGPAIAQYQLAAGPYKVVCKNKDAVTITGFQKPLVVTMKVPKATREKYKDISYYGHKAEDEWELLTVTNSDSDSSNDIMQLEGATTFAAMGKAGKTLIIWKILLALLILGGIVLGVLYVLIWLRRRKQENVYEDYLHKSQGW